MTSDRLSVELPVDGMLPRVGKIRLGTVIPYEREGQTRYRPSKADHFVVVEDESGITSADAAAAFHAAYGDEPTRIRAMLAGETSDANMEGAWRLYGSGGKLKRRCNGELVDEKSATGANERKPCVCGDRRGTGDRYCTLTYTIQLLLPDVAGVGVWQLDTGSDISSRRMSTWLRMVEQMRGGDLRGLEFSLYLVPVTVAPEGKATKVYVLDPRLDDWTPRQVLTGQASGSLPRGAGGELPPPAADEAPEPTLDHGGFIPADTVAAAGVEPPAAAISSSPAGEHDAGAGSPEPAAVAESSTAAAGGDQADEEARAAFVRGVMRDDLKAQLDSMLPQVKARLREALAKEGVGLTVNNVVASYGNTPAARDGQIDLGRLLETLESQQAAAEQTTLEGT